MRCASSNWKRKSISKQLHDSPDDFEFQSDDDRSEFECADDRSLNNHIQVGTLLGAMTRALIRQETESGFVRGAAIGAISSVVFCIEVFESSLLMWQSDESEIGCLLYLIVIVSSVSGKLVHERIGPAMLSVVQSQMGPVEKDFDEVQNIFKIAGCKGLPEYSFEKIPKIIVTSDNNVDDLGQNRLYCLEHASETRTDGSGTEMDTHLEEKIWQFKEFVDSHLKPGLVRAIAERDKVCEQKFLYPSASRIV